LPRVPLSRIRIDERTWEQGSEARKQEWQGAINELLDPNQLTLRQDASELRVTLTEQTTSLELRDEQGEVLCQVSIPRTALADHMTEYVDIVRQIARDDAPGGLSRLEALDMAKKVTHDRGGRILRQYCRPFGMDLATARRLFTLLLALRIDTTRLVGVHGHRRVR
jgi:uncharacterized protein (UPF0262 family)